MEGGGVGERGYTRDKGVSEQRGWVGGHLSWPPQAAGRCCRGRRWWERRGWTGRAPLRGQASETRKRKGVHGIKKRLKEGRTLIWNEGSVGDGRGEGGTRGAHAHQVLACVQLAVQLRARPRDRLLPATRVREGDRASKALSRKVDASALQLDAYLDHHVDPNLAYGFIPIKAQLLPPGKPFI